MSNLKDTKIIELLGVVHIGIIYHTSPLILIMVCTFVLCMCIMLQLLDDQHHLIVHRESIVH